MSASVCAVVGASGSGKTLLIEQVVPVLARAGVRVGYVKHAPHGFDMDRAGSDSGRVRAAGAADVVVTGNGETAHVTAQRDSGDALPALGTHLAASEIVLLEGFSRSAWPKIRVRAAGTSARAVAPPVLLELERAGTRWEAAAVEQVAATVLRLAQDADGPQVTVVADGVEVPVQGFAARVVASGVLGVTGALRGVDDPAVLSVTVRQAR